MVRYYTRFCANPDCDNMKQVGYKPKGHEMCRPCRAKLQTTAMNQRNTKPIGTHIRYWYFCPLCPSVRESKVKLKSSLCGSCSRKRKGLRAGKNHYTYGQPRVDTKYYRTCPTCPKETATIEVASKKDSGIIYCRKHVPKIHKPKVVIAPPKLRKTYKGMSESAIAIRRMENEEHKKAQEAKEELPQMEQSESLRLQEEFIRKRKNMLHQK